MDTDEKKRIERVYTVYDDFYHRIKNDNDWMKISEIACVAAKLTAIYFDNLGDYLDDEEENDE